MAGNVEITEDKIEVYVHKLFELSDQYIQEQFDGNKEQVSKYFRDMIFYMADRLPKIPTEDIKALDNLFIAYVRLCCRFGKLPTLECFAWLSGINRCTFSDWRNGEYRKSGEHSNTVKGWLDFVLMNYLIVIM